MRVRLPFLIPGVILFLLGVFWALQGADVIRQGFMAGQRQWLVIGLIIAVVGLVLGYLGLSSRTAQA
ncbi:MAG TPA: hypothetical protein VKF59_02805 [Candidatus Dormibacteraeota bacterium]|nr:hypothetical protein [Candidatus Dormibacteraeota bacterium]